METLPDDLREALDEQSKLHGSPLYPYLFYARNPAYFRAANVPLRMGRAFTGAMPVACERFKVIFKEARIAP